MSTMTSVGGASPGGGLGWEGGGGGGAVGGHSTESHAFIELMAWGLEPVTVSISEVRYVERGVLLIKV